MMNVDHMQAYTETGFPLLHDAGFIKKNTKKLAITDWTLDISAMKQTQSPTSTFSLSKESVLQAIQAAYELGKQTACEEIRSAGYSVKIPEGEDGKEMYKHHIESRGGHLVRTSSQRSCIFMDAILHDLVEGV